MKTYKSFGALAKTLAGCVARMEMSLAVAMEAGAVIVEEAAKAEIGHYQRENMGDDRGRWEGWAELKPATKKDRLRQGYDENDPLLRSGEMRDSIEHVSTMKYFVVGSKSDILLWQELGTARIQPRSVLALALFRSTPLVMRLIGKTIEKTLAGKK